MSQRILYSAAFALAFAYFLAAILCETRPRFVLISGVCAGLLASVGFWVFQVAVYR